ncbi:NAD-dependent protein deacylase [Lactobacillus sp. S2-2]|uniref:NAD-dependent protein deacylase n=1 Tax=Lactobacillus sp. S2-2 TaxID=2692917 RepID=UPI001F011B9F|nr:NAD-dependent protein deacylase [Lactobacillus sp. S2-2]MCF6515847.1 NAD-dependent protein deacylase [Lactobacillus sp. S2-2]
MNSEIQSKFDTAKRVVFLTGAGVSTASGIPDYRSKNGIYQNNKDRPAEYFLSHACLMNEPKEFYNFVMKNMYFPDAKPNIIHQKQSDLCNQGKATVITQNVDDLYQKANCSNLLTFHGNLYQIKCMKCHKKVDYEMYQNDMYHQNCGGMLRPEIVLYDEGLDPQVIQQSIEKVMNSDLIVIVGTSMRVYPFAGLLDYVKNGTDVIAVNQENLDLPINFEMIQMDAKNFFKELKI